jgi:uncharacterized protein
MLLKFYGNLNLFLRGNLRNRPVEFQLDSRRSIKNLIESLGIPHTEVAIIQANGSKIDFDYIVKDSDSITVSPFGFHGENGKISANKPQSIGFVADTHLGKLTKYLRMLGFDCKYRENISDKEIIDVSIAETRIALTRDKGILMNKQVQFGCFLYSQNSKKQLMEVIERYDLIPHANPFSRCMECNGTMAKADKSEIIDRLPKDTRSYFQTFYKCLDCDKIYWKGSHYDKMSEWIKEIRSNNGNF